MRPRRLTPIAPVLAALSLALPLLLACADPGDVPQAAAAAPSAAGAPAASSACGAAGLAPGQTATMHLASGGADREYRVHVPLAGAGAPLPVVLNFHGLGGDAPGQETGTGFVPVSDRAGFLLVTPQGGGSPHMWTVATMFAGPYDDIAFVDDLLGRLASDFCVDADRIYATGFSNGAFFVSALACARSDRIAAVAPVAGVFYPGGEACGRAVPLLAFHNTDDPTVPYTEGLVIDRIPYAGATAAVAAWAAHDGCEPTPPVAAESDQAAYSGCDAPVGLVTGAGGHSWPAGAAARIWAFFEPLHLP
jgi:polyhydroxybutyrate depolymerase